MYVVAKMCVWLVLSDKLFFFWPCCVQVWNHNVVKDQFMGQAIFMAQAKGQPEHNVAVLKKRGRDSEEAAGGNLSVVITTTEDLRSL